MWRVEGNPLRILFAVPTRWTPTLGLPRVSIEISDRLQAMGHQCEKFSMEDVAPSGLSRFKRFFSRAYFQRKLRDHLREHGQRYDVVQAECDVLPFVRRAYRFDGVLISKSNGLPQIYERYLESGVLPELRRAAGEHGTLVGNTMRRLGKYAAGGMEGIARGFIASDQIHLLNSDEVDYVKEIPGCESKIVLMPNGLSEDRANELACSSTPDRRAANNTVAYVGTWALRKGKVEFPAIVRSVRSRRPATRFSLVGTFASEEQVLHSFALEDRSYIDVRPKFEPEDLPALLKDAKCGVFPSHVEGFGLGVLEMLAAGLPVIAWDAPGPREMLGDAGSGGAMTPPGDAAATADELLRLLDSSDYAKESSAALERSRRFRWADIAERFLETIEAAPCT